MMPSEEGLGLKGQGRKRKEVSEFARGTCELPVTTPVHLPTPVHPGGLALCLPHSPPGPQSLSSAPPRIALGCSPEMQPYSTASAFVKDQP